MTKDWSEIIPDTGGMLRRGGQCISILLALAVLSQALWARMLECRCACCRPATADSPRTCEGDGCAASDLPACCRAKAEANGRPAPTHNRTSPGRPLGCPPGGCSSCFCSTEEDRLVQRNPLYADSAPKAALFSLPLEHDAQDSPATIALGRWRCEALWPAPPVLLRELYCVWRN